MSTHILCIQELQSVLYYRSVYIEALDQGFIPPDLRNKKNRYGEKNEAIEKLAMEASIILDSCKPDKVKVKNPTGVRPKGREKQKRIKSGREISMKKIVVPGGSDHVDGGLRDGPSAVVVPGGSDHVEGGLRGGASGSVSV
ncbi:hypothetical protein Tco_1339930 [Tanacetum coccineum]